MMPGADTSKSTDKYLNQLVQECCRLFCTQLKIAIIWILEKNLYVRIPRRTSLSSRTSSWIKLAVWIISVISARRRCCGCKALQIYQIDLATWFSTGMISVSLNPQMVQLQMNSSCAIQLMKDWGCYHKWLCFEAEFRLSFQISKTQSLIRHNTYPHHRNRVCMLKGWAVR